MPRKKKENTPAPIDPILLPTADNHYVPDYTDNKSPVEAHQKVNDELTNISTAALAALWNSRSLSFNQILKLVAATNKQVAHRSKQYGLFYGNTQNDSSSAGRPRCTPLD